MMPLSATKAWLWDYFILAARLLLAYTFISCGHSKLTGGQFGLTATPAALPVGQLGLFKLSWYLFGQEPFRSFFGVSQIVAGMLLLRNRTALFGALLLLPIAANVLVVGLTHIRILPTFAWRLSYYIGLIGLICWHYRDRRYAAYCALTHGLTARFRYRWWAYLLLPLAALGVEVVGVLPQISIAFLLHPWQTWHCITKLSQALVGHLSN